MNRLVAALTALDALAHEPERTFVQRMGDLHVAENEIERLRIEIANEELARLREQHQQEADREPTH